MATTIDGSGIDFSSGGGLTSWTEILSGVSGTKQTLNIADFKSKYSEFQVVLTYVPTVNDDYVLSEFSSTNAISTTRNTIFAQSRYASSTNNNLMQVMFDPHYGTVGGFVVDYYSSGTAETDKTWKLYAR